jgi:hypothetical protein
MKKKLVKEKEVVEEVMETPKKKPEEAFDFDTFEIRTLEDFAIYNKHARKAKRPVKVPDESFHKKIKIKFQRFDQPENVLKARVRNKDIDWKGQLMPGNIYELPVPVVNFLNNLATPIFGEVDVNDGGTTKKETRQIGERSRFSCQMVMV